MIAITYYLLKVIIISTVLFGYYWFALRNKVFHGYNRFYLLAIVGLSLLLPMMQIGIKPVHTNPTTAIKMLQVVTATDDFVDEINITNTSKTPISFTDVIPCIYLIISMFLLFAFIQLIIKLIVLLKKYEVVQLQNIYLVNTDAAKGTPFSFFRTIFWNNEIDIQSNTGQAVFKHELAHIQQRHSYDKIFMTLVLTIFWCNPIFWLIKKELNMIHEFIADKYAVEDGDTAEFAKMLLTIAYPSHSFNITNHFFYSPLKRRLAMITKNKNPKVNYISRLLALPLMLLVFAAFTLKARTVINKEKNIIQTKVSQNSNELVSNNEEGISLVQKLSEIIIGTNNTKSNTDNLELEKPITVVIDAGHGGKDDGAFNQDGTKEKEIALLLLQKIKAINTNKKLNLIFTRETDVYQSVKEKANFTALQNADLFISIHLDAAPKKEEQIKTGLNVFVSNGNINNSEKSKLFASSIIEKFTNNYDIKVESNPQQRKMGIWVLTANNIPSILIEAGYITNNKDLAYLKSDKGQTAFAINVLNAIESYAATAQLENVEVQKMPVDSPPVQNPNINITRKDKSLSFTKKGNNGAMQMEIAVADLDKNAIIINGNLYNQKDLINKVVNAKVCKMQDKGTPDMIAKYGDAAKEGVMIFENATIENWFSEKLKDAIKINADEVYFVDASERKETSRIQIGNKTITSKLNLDPSNKPIIIIDGETKNEQDLKAMNPESILTINVLKDKAAIELYGEKGKNGVILVTSIFNNNINKNAVKEATILIGGSNNPRRSFEEFKQSKEITVTYGFEFVSATVYFSGEGFSNVEAIELNGKDLTQIKSYLERCEKGTSVTFVNVKVKGPDGLRTIDDRSTTLY